MAGLLVRGGIDVIGLAQSHDSASIDRLFRLITFLGYPEFYLLLVPLIFWCTDKRVGIRLAILLMLSSYLNAIVKDALAWPRPPADQVRQVTDHAVEQETFGMPSGHAQNSVVILGYLASATGGAWWSAAAILAFLIGVSKSSCPIPASSASYATVLSACGGRSWHRGCL